jgi:hypothetical protein
MLISCELETLYNILYVQKEDAEWEHKVWGWNAAYEAVHFAVRIIPFRQDRL